MFSGIVESVQEVISLEAKPHATRIWVRRPPEFSDLHVGDSIATNGVCLTLESMDLDKLQFALGAETLKVLDGHQKLSVGSRLNLERSLQFGDRIHGHLVSGHVDSMGEVARSDGDGDSWFLDVWIQPALAAYVWKKGSITLNGVSLTINELTGGERLRLSVCLIPETLKRTNLQALKIGDWVTVEPDYFAKMVANQLEHQLAGAYSHLVGRADAEERGRPRGRSGSGL